MAQEIVGYRVKKWSDFQHYNRPRPIWIKLHRRLLDDHDFNALSTSSRATLVMLWMMAAESNDGTLPVEKSIAWRLRCPEQQISKALSELTHFLDPIYSESRESLALEEKRRDREETEKRTNSVCFSEEEFQKFWSLHPYGPKKDARDSYRKIRKAGAPPDEELLSVLSKQLEERRESEESGEFVPRLPHLCRWFSHHRWEDAPLPRKRNAFLEGEAS